VRAALLQYDTLATDAVLDYEAVVHLLLRGYPAVETVRAATRPSMRCTPIRSSEDPNGRSAVGNAIIPPVGFNSTPTFGNTFWRQGCGEGLYVTLPAISFRGHSGRSRTALISMP